MTQRRNSAVGTEERLMLEEERTRIRDGLLRNMRKGEQRYIITEQWHHQWKKYVGMGGYGHSRGDPTLYPGSIDLSPLYDENGELKRDLVELRDYRAVPEDTWQLIVERYGLAPKSPPPIVRNVCLLRNRENFSVEVVELYLLEIIIRLQADPSKSFRATFSRLTPFEQIYSWLKKQCGFGRNTELRLWLKNEATNSMEPVERDWLLEHVCNRDGAVFVLETRLRQGNEQGSSSTSSDVISKKKINDGDDVFDLGPNAATLITQPPDEW